MKIFHLSDLHIGLRLYNRDLKEDQEAVFKEIADYAAEEQPDAIVIAGDLYDRAVPSAEAVEVFDRFVECLTAAAPGAVLMMISGNHDSGPRINCFRGILARQNLYMIGMPPKRPEDRIQQVTLFDEYGPVHVYLLPFVRPSMVRETLGAAPEEPLSYEEALRRLLAREEICTEERNVLVSHQFYLPDGTDADTVERMDSEIRTIGNIDRVSSSVLEPFDYAALGHIHKPMKAGEERFCYCGTPLPVSVSEAGQKKGIVVVELGEKGKVKTRVLPLHPLRQVRIIRGALEEVLSQACGDYVSILLTDKEDLNVLDMQDRLRAAFPRLLEIRRETVRRADYQALPAPVKELDPFALCCAFLKEADPEEQEILRDVINAAGGGAV